MKLRMHICPCSWAVVISKKMCMQTYFGLVTLDSAEGFHNFAFSGAAGPDLPAFLLYLRIAFLEAHLLKTPPTPLLYPTA